jgi:hypothetical protein
MVGVVEPSNRAVYSVKKRATSNRAKARKRSVSTSRETTTAEPASAPPSALVPGSRYKIKLRFWLNGELREEAFEVDDNTLYPEAKRWNYVVRNRERLSDRGRESSSDVAVDRLAEIFGGKSDGQTAKVRLNDLLRDIARAGLVEVSVPGDRGQYDAAGYAARVFPWEMVLTFLTWTHRTSGEGLTVVRHLLCSCEQRWPDRGPKTLLAVSSAPEKIAQVFNLDGECRLIAGILGLEPCKPLGKVFVEEPDANTLKELVTKGKPDVVHLTGVDPYYLEYNKLLPAPRLRAILALPVMVKAATVWCFSIRRKPTIRLARNALPIWLPLATAIIHTSLR